MPDTSSPTLGRESSSVWSVGKDLPRKVILTDTSSPTLGRESSSAWSVGKDLPGKGVLTDTATHTELKFSTTHYIITVPINTQEVRQSCIKPDNWNIDDKSSEYERNIDKGRVNDLVIKIHDLTVDEIHKELQQILIEPALVTFPQFKQKTYIKRVIIPS